MTTRSRIAGPCALALLGAASLALADPPPDAGALQQQINRDLAPPSAATEHVAPPPLAPAEAPAAGAVTVTVSRFEFEGNTRLSSAKLERVVRGFVGRPLDFNQLQAAVAAVADAYRQAGWVVRVFLPQQTLANGGAVRIQVVEARFGDARVEQADPAQPPRVDPARLRAIVQRAQPAGEPLSSTAVDRALMLLGEVPGIAVSGALAAGQAPGQTDLVLKSANRPPFSGDVRADNAGSHSTGGGRLLGNLAWASPTGIGDLGTVNLLHTAGSDYARAAYRRPVGDDGWTAGINTSVMRYELVGAEYAALDAKGGSTTVGLDAAWPWVRSRQGSVTLSFAPEHKAYVNESGGATTTRYHIDTLPVTLAGSRSDALLGGGANGGSLTAAWGDVDLAGSPNEAADALTTRTAGTFVKYRATLNRQQKLGERGQLRLAWSAQLADRNLDSAEKFYLGGASGVRAYPSGEGGGSEGQMLNVDFTTPLPAGFVAGAFYDWGRVRVNHDNDFLLAPALNVFSLQGAGLSLAWSHPLRARMAQGVSAKISWARRIGDNPNATPAGDDQDGTLIRNRLWVEAALAF